MLDLVTFLVPDFDLAHGLYEEECSEVENAKNKQILKNKHILYVCDDCNKTRKSKKEMPKTNCDINNQKLNELKADFN